MNKSRILKYFLVLISIVLSICNIGFSNFVIGTSLDANIKEGSQAVCYIGDTKFTTIEKALKYASEGDNASVANTIFVIPGTNPTITKDCTIALYDTLCLPYEGELWNDREGKSTLNNRFADDCAAMVDKNRKSLVTIKKGVTLTVNGTLQIGGILGNASVGSQGLQGQTSGSYAEILMEVGDANYSGAKIEVAYDEVNKIGGSIDCRGYIKETEILDDLTRQPQLELKSGSNLQLPFVVYDFQGATATGGIFLGSDSIGALDIGKTIERDGYVCPFNLFDLPNIQIRTIINSGANVKGLISLHTNSTTLLGYEFKESWNNDSFIVVGAQNALLYINSGYISVRYKPANLGYTEVLYYENNSTNTFVEVYGDCTFGSMIMSLNAQIAQVKINTAKILFPFSYRWNFSIEDGGIVNLNNGIKLMNRSSLTIKSGGTLNLNSGAKVIFYNQSWTDHKTTIPYLPTYTVRNTSTKVSLDKLTDETDLGVISLNPQISGAAKFINNGDVKINSGSSFGGLIETKFISSTITTSDATFNISSLEANGSGGRNGLSYEFHHVDAQNIIEDGIINLSENKEGQNCQMSNIEANKEYESGSNYYYKLDEFIYTLTITHDQASEVSESGKSKTYKLTALFNSTDGISYIYYTWTCDTGSYFNNNSSLVKIKDSTENNVTFTTPANSSTKNDAYYTVQCVASFTVINNGKNKSAEGSKKFTAAMDGCITEDTPVLMGDGKYKKVSDIKPGDLALTWNFFTGKYEPQKVAFVVDHGAEIYKTVRLNFSNGEEIKIIGDHGLFDYDLNKFVYITADNYINYIGHQFVVYSDSENYILSSLLSGFVSNEYTSAYSITTEYNYNVIANGLFTAPPPETLYNRIPMSGKLQYDIEQFNKDVQEYGLYSYDVFSPYGISEYTFKTFNGAYLKIPVEKGLFTFEYIIEQFNLYKEWINL